MLVLLVRRLKRVAVPYSDGTVDAVTSSGNSSSAPFNAEDVDLDH